MEEIWKPVKGYEGRYEVSNLGRVKSLGGTSMFGKNLLQRCEKILKNTELKNGYSMVGLKEKKFYVHRLVAEAFLSNKDGLPCINHKDENRKNNFVENLEWCSYSYNNTYGNHIDRVKKTLKDNNKLSLNNARNQKVVCLDTGLVFRNIAEASKKTGATNISKCCRGLIEKSGGYRWEYVE